MSINKIETITSKDPRLKLSFIEVNGIIIGKNAAAKAKVYSDYMNKVSNNYMTLFSNASVHYSKHQNNYDAKTQNTLRKAFNVLDNYSDKAKKRAQQLSSYINQQIKDKKIRDLADKVDALVELLKQDPALAEQLEQLGL